jgi:glycine oxidase
MTVRTDIIILGAGVVGLSTARQLAATGARVTILDAGNPGGQGSRAAAGVAIPSIRLLDDPDMLAFTTTARSVLIEDVAALGGGALRRGGGILRPMPDDKARLALEARAARVEGWLGRWAPAEEVAALEPALTGAPIAGAFVNDEGFMVDTDAYLSAMLHELATHGVEVRLSEAALLVSDSSQGVEVRTAQGAMKAEWLVVAAGAWSGTLAGLPALPVKPQRGQMLTVFHPRVRLTRIISGPTYLAPWRGGEVVVGATEEDAGFACHTTPAGLMHLSAAVCRLAPTLREARFTGSWAGLRSTSPDGRPLLGRYPGTSRTVIASGHGGQGILTGALTGRAVAELLSSGRSEVAAPFTPERSLAAPRPTEG